MGGEGMFTVKDYRDALSEGYLLASRCRRCGAVQLPPRPICPKCGSGDLEAFKAPKRGRVAAYTVIHVPPSRFKGEEPYAVAVVELLEGVRVSGRMLDVSEADLRVGLEVEADFIKLGEEILLCFRPLKHP